MSAIRVAARTVSRTPLRAVGRSRKLNLRVVITIVVGVVAIQLLNVLMAGVTSAGAYEISNLKIERANLSTQADIIGSEVNSLSSNQNLVNVAHALGMVSNVNPVFLRLSDSAVIGKPRRAQANERTVSKNLVPNAAMTTDTNVSNLAEVSMNSVLASTSSSVGAHSGSIQASPTY
jgi:cell division protein FtsL